MRGYSPERSITQATGVSVFNCRGGGGSHGRVAGQALASGTIWLAAVTGEGGQRQTEHEGAHDRDESAGERADYRGGQAAQGARLQVAELAAARGHHVVGRHYPAAKPVRGYRGNDRSAEHHGEGVRGPGDGQQ